MRLGLGKCILNERDLNQVSHSKFLSLFRIRRKSVKVQMGESKKLMKVSGF